MLGQTDKKKGGVRLAKILFASDESGFWVNDSHIWALEESGHEVVKVSDAGQLLDRMDSREGDLVIIYGGPMPLGLLGHKVQGAHALIAGLQAVQAALEGGCETPVLILETYDLPPRVRKCLLEHDSVSIFSNDVIPGINILLERVERLLVEAA